MNNTPFDFRALLEQSHFWLLKKCAVATRSRPGLRADELAQQVAAAFLEAAPGWFSQGPTQDPVARARSKMHFLIMNRVTAYDRECRRHDPDDVEPDAIAAEDPDLGARLQKLQAFEAVDALANPAYRLALRAVFREMLVQPSEFKAAAEAFRRDPGVAWELFDQRRLGTEERAWRRLVAEIIRCVEPLGQSSRSDLKTASDWLDRTVQRAIARVILDLAQAEVAR